MNEVILIISDLIQCSNLILRISNKILKLNDMQSTAILQNFDLTMTSLSSHHLNLSGYVPIWQKDVDYENGEIVRISLLDH